MKTSLWLIMALLVSCLPLCAQQLVYEPHKNVVVDVTFEGKDASRVTDASYVFTLDGQPIPSQPSFLSSINCGGSSKLLSTPNTFEISCPVAINQAAGDYRLTNISAGFRELNMGLSYNEGEFPARKITIKNTGELSKPKIKDVQVH
jgi:hypothetical protein